VRLTGGERPDKNGTTTTRDDAVPAPDRGNRLADGRRHEDAGHSDVVRLKKNIGFSTDGTPVTVSARGALPTVAVPLCAGDRPARGRQTVRDRGRECVFTVRGRTCFAPKAPTAGDILILLVTSSVTVVVVTYRRFSWFTARTKT